MKKIKRVKMEKENLSSPKLKTLEKDLVKVEKAEDYLDKEKLKLSEEKEKIYIL